MSKMFTTITIDDIGRGGLVDQRSVLEQAWEAIKTQAALVVDPDRGDVAKVVVSFVIRDKDHDGQGVLIVPSIKTVEPERLIRALPAYTDGQGELIAIAHLQEPLPGTGKADAVELEEWRKEKGR